MVFKDDYTTQDKISADKEDKEVKKTLITNDAFAIGEVVEQLLFKLESLRGLLI